MKLQKTIRFTALYTVVLFFHCATTPYVPWTAENPADLARDRSLFPTQLKVKRPSPVGDSSEAPPAGAREVYYKSGNLRLKAWLSQAPDDGKKHPAIVFAHGGFSRDAEDWPYLKPYLEKGYIVMMPAWRGENGNPGYFEFFFGEVDDVIAAGNFLAEHPTVDKEKLFLAGHSAGGTLAILTALTASPYKAIASFSGSPDQEVFFRTMWDGGTPFDKKDGREVTLRSPMAYVTSLRNRLFLSAGAQEHGFKKRNLAFAAKAKDLGKNCEFAEIPGDHFSALSGSMERSIHLFTKPPMPGAINHHSMQIKQSGEN